MWTDTTALPDLTPLNHLRDRHGGAFLVSGLGLVLLALYLGYVNVNDYYLEGPVWLFPIGLTLMLVLSIGLFGGGYWLTSSEFNSETGWRVAFWCFAGVIEAVSMTFWPIFYQRVVGVAVEDPVFILLVSAGLGGNGGLLAGIYDMRSWRRRREIERSRDSFRFPNRLLRHNVLNAVHVINGHAELLGEEPLSDRAEKQVSVIREKGDQIDDLVGNTRVLVQRIDEDRPLDQVDLTRLVADELTTVMSAHDHAMFDQHLEEGVQVRADELFSAAIENLVSNAVEHNDRETPHVEVTLETRVGVAVLSVADDGPGIPPDQRQAAFEPGSHGDHGLGLYLVNTLVDDYGGTVRIEENDPRGTVVVVELPVAE